MNKNNYNVVGVMSGTSLDGIDVAYVNFTFSETWSYQITAAETIPYTQNWQKILSEAVNFDEHKLRKLDRDYTHLLGKVISEFLVKNDIFDPHAVCSHGHTIKHEPENGFTLQIGNQPELAKLLNCKVVCDFRVQDVQLGGQGAPLVPVGDELLFGKYDYCLNIGGFANISTINGGKRLAYDICAVNTVLNVLSQHINLPYDKDGEVAASGKVIPGLREELEKIPFYGLRPPKSLGIEWVQKHIFPLFQKYGSIPDLLRTYTEHAAEMIANEFRNSSEEKVLVTGGGAFNQFLIAEIQKRTKTEVVIPPADVVNFKEALIFAFLGVLKLRGENNVLSSVTGASKDHSSGKIFNA
ncbi:anhydro-N-acetylmuramic acid kinase [Salinimicrobium tongyeongense]|uniref:Anhydro-N-acetylmuramic acid kinase n=1 Tax=Salinimicrobium tongyeongense TaxID=2809707 RepID=A0ABY6NMZ2_9FLAO|nr:anhydro-N-acetylmuramic acid kinase [Salinimicrobium tongyeongense]UZH54270.1 anhydro-N-acetylmuramic acid kinase [Salinimicrobium tongyeongense]